MTTCSHIAEIDHSAFSDACKSYPFLCNTSKKVTVTWLRCKHCVAIASSQARSGFDHFSANQTCNTHRVVDIKTSKLGHHQ